LRSVIQQLIVPFTSVTQCVVLPFVKGQLCNSSFRSSISFFFFVYFCILKSLASRACASKFYQSVKRISLHYIILIDSYLVLKYSKICAQCWNSSYRLSHELQSTNCYSEFVCILNILFIRCAHYTTVYISYFWKDAYNFNISVSITYHAQYLAINWTVNLNYVFLFLWSLQSALPVLTSLGSNLANMR
jgi:hypothetical protein